MENQETYLTELESKQRKIFNHYGFDHQLEKLEEECLELVIAIKHRDKSGNGDFRNMVEEIADVKNLIEQIELQVPYFEKGINLMIEYKTKRELERIKVELEEAGLEEFIEELQL